MNLRLLASAAAASLLAAGVAHAQLGSSATPGTGVTPNPAAPAPPQPGTTGVPSPDSSRPTGADAGKTSLPNGQIEQQAAPPAAPSGTVSTTTTTTTTTTGADVTAPSAATSASNASFTNMVTTNGPVPDTPENRRKYGGPMSRAGKHTAAKGN